MIKNGPSCCSAYDVGFKLLYIFLFVIWPSIQNKFLYILGVFLSVFRIRISKSTVTWGEMERWCEMERFSHTHKAWRIIGI